MNIGWVGLGKLGEPIAREIGERHKLWPNDVVEAPVVRTSRGRSHLVTYEKSVLLENCDLIFVAVQTPHLPEYEGITRIPETRADFDYSYLTAAVSELAKAGPQRPPLVVISTVLPGTIEREILPLWDGPVIYNPLFIAMGEEVADFLDPEFVLLGVDDPPDAPEAVLDFYSSLNISGKVNPTPYKPARNIVVGYREAELAKMAYNTFIGLKIAFANTVGELCHRLEIDADAVMDVLRSGSKRIISGAYLSPGMGDGGPCHPRDNIALSWLAREAGMSFDLFGAVMEQRERHIEWLADLICEQAGVAHDIDWIDGGRNQEADITILGKSYKPNTSLRTGSPALLLANLLIERGVEFEHEDPDD